MPRRLRFSVLGASALLVGIAAMAQTNEFPWDRVVGADVSLLDDSEHARVVQFAEIMPNYYGCEGTVAHCISQEVPDPTAQRLAGFVVRRVLAGDPDEMIQARYLARQVSAVPPLTFDIDVEEAPCMGAENPLVTIVEFADFECPFCRAASSVIEAVVAARCCCEACGL